MCVCIDVLIFIIQNHNNQEIYNMGKTMDALLGKGFKTSKFKNLVELVSSRIAVLEKQHRLKCMQAQSDVVELLKLGHQESALLRVELVILEQDMLDAYAMVENFCNLLVERVVLIENNRECPDELKEAVSSLIFAASKCGEFQDLENIRSMFTKRFGKEFANNAVDLCNNCGVCPKIVSKLSTQRPSFDSKLIMLKEIALANGIDLHIEEESPMVTEEVKLDTSEEQLKPHESAKNDKREIRQGDASLSINEQKQGEKIPEEGMQRRKYKDFKAAAQAAYKLAAHAAVAARAAVELAQPLDKGPDRPRKCTEKKFATCFDESSKSYYSIQGNETLEKKKFENNNVKTQKVLAEVISRSSPQRENTETISTGHLKGD